MTDMPKKAAAEVSPEVKIAQVLAEEFPGIPDPWPEIADLVMNREVLPHQFEKPASRLLSAFVIATAIGAGIDVPLIGSRAGLGGTQKIRESLSVGLDLQGIKPDVAEKQIASLQGVFGSVMQIRVDDRDQTPMDQAIQAGCDILITTRSPNDKGKGLGDLALAHLEPALQRAYQHMDHPDAVCPLARMGRMTMRPLVAYVPKMRSEEPANIPTEDYLSFTRAIEAGEDIRYENQETRAFTYKGRDYRMEKILNDKKEVKGYKTVLLGDEQANFQALRSGFDDVILTRVFSTHAAVVLGRDGSVTPHLPLRDVLCAEGELRRSGMINAKNDPLMGFLRGTLSLVDTSGRYVALGNDHDRSVLHHALSTMALAVESAPTAPMFHDFVDMIETEVLSVMVEKDKRNRGAQSPAPMV